jgi:hypothetical protein
MIDAQATSALIKDVPKFDGNPKNFGVWLDKLTSVRETVSEDLFLKTIAQKLGTAPSMFVKTIGTRAETAEGLLLELSRQYDDYSKPMFSFHKFNSFSQGTSSIADHHAELYHLLRGMETNVTSKDNMLKSGYIHSLSAEYMQHKLLKKTSAKIEKTRPCTLQDLMEIVIDDDRLNTLGKHDCATVGSARLEEECSVLAGHQSKRDLAHGRQETHGRGAREGDNLWCPIHQCKGHDISTCHCRDNEQCYHCKTTLVKGTYAAHMKVCAAPTCEICKKKGHQAESCRLANKGNNRDRHGANRGREKRYRYDNPRDRSPQPKSSKPKQVASASVGTAPVDDDTDIKSVVNNVVTKTE